ncbi:MAG: H(+)/Cl(-) exchange transporter ClcA [Pirellulales bacterium]|nr:H(+)/Cl(-) exchange transporter ClcA [Pirellulales bacterium]
MNQLESVPADRTTVTGFLTVCLLATLVGAVAGSFGAAFHYGVDATVSVYAALATALAGHPLLTAFSAALLGALMTAAAFMLVRRYAPEAAGSGVQEIEGALSGLRPLCWWRLIPVKFVGGVLAMGAGLVLGREGPSVHVGGCVGRMIGEKAKATVETLNTLIASGAAAGLSAAFGAPLASVIFVTEEMRDKFRYSFLSIHAVALACVAAKIMNDQVFGRGPLLPLELKMNLTHAGPVADEIYGFAPLFLGLGVLIGLGGAAFNTILLKCLRTTDRLSSRSMFIFVLGIGGLAGALTAMAPEFADGGESLIEKVFFHSPTASFLLMLMIARTGVVFFSYSAGVPGGIFFPLLTLGAVSGMAFGVLAQMLLPELPVHPSVLALATMGGLFAATVRAPLTGIVLVSELTWSFQLLPPLILTCFAASLTAQLMGSRPVYELLLERTLALEARKTGCRTSK